MHVLTRASPPRPRGTWRGGWPGIGWPRPLRRAPRQWPTPGRQGRDGQARLGVVWPGFGGTEGWGLPQAKAHCSQAAPSQTAGTTGTGPCSLSTANPAAQAAQLTTSDWPRRQSPAAKMPSMDVANWPYSALKLERGSTSMPGGEGRGGGGEDVRAGERAATAMPRRPTSQQACRQAQQPMWRF